MKDKKDKSVQAIFSLVKKHKFKAITMFSVFIVSNVFESILPYFIGQVAGALSAIPFNEGRLVALLVAMVGANCLHDFTWFIGDVTVLNWLFPVTYEFRKIMITSAWQYEYKGYIEKPSGKIAGSIHEGLGTASDLFNTTMYEYIADLVRFPTLIAVVFLANKANAIVYMIFVLLVALVSLILVRPLKRASSTHADNSSSVLGRLYDSYANFVNVKSFNATTKETSFLHEDNDSMLVTSRRKHFADMRYWRASGVIIRWILWPIIISLDIYLFRRGHLTVAEFVTSIAVLQQFTNSIWGLVEHIGSFSTKLATYRQNYNYLYEGKDIVAEYYQRSDMARKTFKPIFDENISINKLNFAYPDRPDSKVLKKINLNIKKNEKIGIVGKSGSGKSTLIKLLLGFYDYKDGAIQVDGKSICKEELSLLNSYVPQDTTLFQQSVGYNIAYAKEDKVPLSEIIRAAKKAHAHEFINTLPDKYDTLVGERGIKLSLGQRQRIAIARAFLKHSDLLILDEATSALDSKTEKLVQDSLEELWHGKTVIAIAHRLSTLNNVDRIIVMDQGRIVEEGTKSELLAAGGIFAELWQHQKNGLIIDEEEEG